MNSPQTTPLENPVQKKGLRLRYRTEHERVWDLHRSGLTADMAAKPAIDPVAMDDYMIECAGIPKAAVLAGKAPTPEELPKDLEAMYRDERETGNSFCVVVLPFNNGGLGQNSLEASTWNNFLLEKRFMRQLVVRNSDHLTTGYDDMPGYFFDHLPDLIKKDISEGGCTFQLKYPYPAGDSRNKEWFAKNYAMAINNLQALFAEMGMRSPLPAA